MPKLFILCGLPYSGKTRLARRFLAGNPNLVFVSIDEILAARGYDWEANRLPDAEGWRAIFEESYEKTRAALGEGRDVLYDSTNHTRASRDALRKVAAEAGADCRVLFLDVSPEVVRERWHQNRETHERFVLDESLLEQTIASLERPAGDERATTLPSAGAPLL